jgi:tetratricopeptide (TPR) repeat protein
MEYIRNRHGQVSNITSGAKPLDVSRIFFITIIFSLLLLLPGCGLDRPEKKGDAEAKAGRFESAIYWYEAALGTDDREAVHWKMAEIFAGKLHDPVGAAYHYRRILALHPNGARADAARAALRRMEGSSGSLPVTPNHSRLPATPKPNSAQEAALDGEKAAKGKVRTYVVQSGDTLVSIAKKFYQAPSRWKDVLDANQNQLSNPDELKPGQTIIIP